MMDVIRGKGIFVSFLPLYYYAFKIFPSRDYFLQEEKLNPVILSGAGAHATAKLSRSAGV
jgi:hypothetical protein